MSFTGSYRMSQDLSNDKLLSGKPSNCLHTVMGPFTFIGFHNSCSKECHWTWDITQKSIEVWLYNKCHKINLSGPFGPVLFYVILTFCYLQACTIETSSLPNDSMQPQLRSLSLTNQGILTNGILTAYFNGVLSYIYAQATWMPPQRNLCEDNCRYSVFSVDFTVPLLWQWVS